MSADPRYPIGKFQRPESPRAPECAQYIDTIEACPSRFRKSVEDLSPAQLDTPYRDGGWTVRQVIHHLPDSHLNAYVRFKLTLTETEPTIKPYDEAAWAKLNDSAETPVEVSLSLLDALHKRWVVMMRGMSEDGWKRRYMHPELGTTMGLDHVLAMYAWHGAHHIAHVTELRKRNGW